MFDQVTVYVVWKEGSARAAALADTLWRWYNHVGSDDMASPAGIPVYFRSKLDATRQLTPAIDPGGPGRSPLNLVLLLVDDAWVDDHKWHRVPEQFANREDVWLAYVSLHPNAPATSPVLQTKQAISVSASADETAYHQAFRRAVTQAFARAVRERGEIGKDNLVVFVSHSKRDGVEEARALRDAITAYGQLSAFFDENDLPWGSNDWAGQLRSAVEQGSAGMLVLETDVYASRPWCRTEVELARTPLHGKEGSHDERVWWVVPTVIVGDPRESWSKVLPELGNVARIGLRGDYARAALDRLVRDILLSATNRLRARAVLRSQAGHRAHALTWVPDPETIRRVRWHIGWEADIVYPGNGLSRFEAERLVKADRDTFRRRPCLHTFSDWSYRGPQEQVRRLPEGTLIALSVSNSPDAARLGFGSVHENATLSWWTTEIVRAGGRVLYGGILAEKGDDQLNKTAPIIAAVVEHSRNADTAEKRPEQPPLVSFQAYPFYRAITSAQRTALFGVCQFVFVDPPGWDDSSVTEQRSKAIAEAPGTPAWSEATAAALQRMRALMARGCAVEGYRADETGSTQVKATTLRLALGGKTEGYTGFMPGIAEEYLEDRLMNLPVVVLRKYGGCAALIADFLLGPVDGPLPEKLSYTWVSGQGFYAGVAASADRLGAAQRWAQLAEQLRTDRAALASGSSFVPGLSADELRTVMASDSDGAIIHTALSGFLKASA